MGSSPSRKDEFLRREQRESNRRKISIPALAPPAKPDGEIRICLDSCCIARGCGKTHEALQAAVARGHLNATIKRVGCVVMCDRTPLIEIARPNHPPIQFSGIHPERVDALLWRHFKPRGILPWLRRGAASALDWLSGETADMHVGAGRTAENPSPRVTAFFGRQRHIATEHYGKLDPLGLDEYLAHDGFAGLRQCLNGLPPSEVIETIDRSGLRGRGGAGFPTARKWRVVHGSGWQIRHLQWR